MFPSKKTLLLACSLLVATSSLHVNPMGSPLALDPVPTLNETPYKQDLKPVHDFMSTLFNNASIESKKTEDFDSKTFATTKGLYNKALKTYKFLKENAPLQTAKPSQIDSYRAMTKDANGYIQSLIDGNNKDNAYEAWETSKEKYKADLGPTPDPRKHRPQPQPNPAKNEDLQKLETSLTSLSQSISNLQKNLTKLSGNNGLAGLHEKLQKLTTDDNFHSEELTANDFKNFDTFDEAKQTKIINQLISDYNLTDKKLWDNDINVLIKQLMPEPAEIIKQITYKGEIKKITTSIKAKITELLAKVGPKKPDPTPIPEPVSQELTAADFPNFGSQNFNTTIEATAKKLISKYNLTIATPWQSSIDQFLKANKWEKTSGLIAIKTKIKELAPAKKTPPPVPHKKPTK